MGIDLNINPTASSNSSCFVLQPDSNTQGRGNGNDRADRMRTDAVNRGPGRRRVRSALRAKQRESKAVCRDLG